MDVRKKVLLDLFASPGTLLPVVGGFSSLILSWAAGGVSLLNFLGIAGILGGLGDGDAADLPPASHRQ